MSNLNIRITRSYSDITKWCEELAGDKVIIYEHEADDKVKRTHCHIMLINSDVKSDALKTRFKKLYGDVHRTDWYFKQCDGDDINITYMSKGRLTPKRCVGWTDEQLAVLRSKWIDPDQTKLALKDGKLVREVKEPKMMTKRQLLELMVADLNPDSTCRDKLKVIRKVLMNNNIVCGRYKQMDYYDAIQMYGYKEDWLVAMERKINSFYDI